MKIIYYIDSDSTGVSTWPNLWYADIGLDIGLAPDKRQAIIRPTDSCMYYRRIYFHPASMG